MACPIPENVQPTPPIAVYNIGSAENFVFRLCDNNGAFYQIIELCAGEPGTPHNYTTSWTAYTPVGTVRSCNENGAEDANFGQLIFCDGGNSNQPFISRVVFDESGDLIPEGSGTYELDAVTPYVVIGPVTVCTGANSGTEYTEGGTSGTIRGRAILWEDTSDTLRTVSAVKPLPVNVVSIVAPALPTGAASASNQASGNATLVLINGHAAAVDTEIAALNMKTPVLGQAAMAASTPVTIANNQSAVPVTGTFWQATQPISITPPSTIYNGSKDVATAGMQVVLAASQAILAGVTVKAKSDNTGIIFVGNAGVTANNGFELEAGESIFLKVANLNTVHLDVSVDGDGVTFIAT